MAQIDQLLHLDGNDAVYNVSFDRARKHLADVLRRMSGHIGWKSRTCDYDIDGFSGYYPEVGEGRVDICRGDRILATFMPAADGGLEFEQYGEGLGYPDNVSPWLPVIDIENGRFCLDPDNLELARRETHGGHEVIYGLTMDGACAFGIDPDREDDNLRRRLVEKVPDIRLVPYVRLNEAFGAWLRKDAVPGFETGPRPQMLLLTYDGDQVRTERELSVFKQRDTGGLVSDWDLIDALRAEGDLIRYELESAVGIDRMEHPGHFKFKHALYPSLSFRDDALFLTTRCGASLGDFITVAKGKVALYRNYDPEKELSVPVKEFAGVNQALDAVRGAVLSRENIEVAKVDYYGYRRKNEVTVKRPEAAKADRGLRR